MRRKICRWFVGLSLTLLIGGSMNAFAQPALIVTSDNTVFNNDASGDAPFTFMNGTDAMLGSGINHLASSGTRQELFVSTFSGNLARLDSVGNQLELLAMRGSVSGLAFDAGDGSTLSDDSLLFIEGSFNASLNRLLLDGTNTVLTVSPDVGEALELNIDPTDRRIYFRNGTTFFRINSDGTGQVTLAADTGGEFIGGFAVIPGVGLVFSLNDPDPEVRFFSFATQTTVSFSIPANVADELNEVAVDQANEKIYFLNGFSLPDLFRINFDGTGRELVAASGAFSSSPVKIQILPDTAVLTPVTVITQPPAVEVNDDRNSVTVFFQNFSEAIESAQGSLSALRTSAQRSRVTFRYDARVRPEDPGAGRVRKKVTKRTRATFNRLPEADYQTNYRAIIFKRKNRKAIQKAKARGVKGLRRRFRRIAVTDFSPSTAFEVK